MTQKIKFLLIIFFLLSLFFSNRGYSFAQENADYFDVNANLSYQVLENNTTKVNQNISIVNKKEFVYSPSYAITLHLRNMSNISVKNSKGAIPYTMTEGVNNAKTVTVNFPDKIIGVGKENNFSFSFTSSDFAQKVGTILTVTIPSLSGGQNFNEYDVHITVPNSYGNPSIVKPEITYSKSGSTFTFSGTPSLTNGMELVFGNSQVYEFDLAYHLENKNVFPIRTEIALPPKTSYQDVLLQNLSPKPTNTYEDSDGNILATYTIQPKTTINAKADVLIKVSKNSTPQVLSDTEKSLYTKPQKYWESTDSEIKKIANTLNTPEDIFNYVVKTLSYDDKKTADKNERLGAKQVLTKPYFAVCLEFTDLFIALARAKGIPARAVEGYAYTNDESDKPVSLFEDVLHAWPEYYDFSKKEWIMVDPTWENTTGGIDYFHSLDFDHVAFAINGAQSTYPVPAGGYKTDKSTKDVTVAFPSNTSFIKKSDISLRDSFSSFSGSSAITGKVTLTNNGNFELPSYNVFIFLDGKKTSDITFPSTPPLGSSTLSVNIPLPKSKNLTSLTNITHTITIQGENGKVLAKTTTRVFPFSQYLIIGGAIIIGLTFILILAIKTRSLPIQR